MHSQDPHHQGSAQSEARGTPVLKQTPAGWTIHLADANGNNVLNLAVFPSKFLAEEALARIIQRQSHQ